MRGLTRRRCRQCFYPALGALVLVSCSPSTVPPQSKDYCVASGAKIPERTRLLRALEYVADNQEQYGRSFYARNAYVKFASAERDKGSAAKGIAAAYLQTTPDCCAVLAPSWKSDNYFASADWDEYRHAELKQVESGLWVVDIMILDRPGTSSARRAGILLKGGSCGTVDQIFRG